MSVIIKQSFLLQKIRKLTGNAAFFFFFLSVFACFDIILQFFFRTDLNIVINSPSY